MKDSFFSPDRISYLFSGWAGAYLWRASLARAKPGSKRLVLQGLIPRQCHMQLCIDLMGYALCRRPPTIADCSRIADSWHCCKRILASLVHQPVVSHDWWLHFGVLGDSCAFFGTLGSITMDTLRSRPGFQLICCPWVLFGMLGASSCGTLERFWGDPGTILGHWRTQ